MAKTKASHLDPPDKKVATADVVRRLLIPIRNRHEPFFEFSPWFLADALQIDQISDEDFATLHRESELFAPLIKANCQCFVFNVGSTEDAESTAYDLVSRIQFVFKTFADRPLVISHAAVVTSEGKQKAQI